MSEQGNTPEFGQGLPPSGGWKRYMTDDPDYSPEYQDEYQRLWHEAAAERDRLAARVAEAELKWPASVKHFRRRAEAAEARVADLDWLLCQARGYVVEPGEPGTVIETTTESAERSSALLARIDAVLSESSNS
jgi:hypothetical protein